MQPLPLSNDTLTNDAPKKKTSGVRKVLLMLWGILWKLALFCILFPVVQVLFLKWVDPPITAMMIFKAWDHLVAGESTSYHFSTAPYSKIPAVVFQVLISAEDQRFYSHQGFDWKSIEKMSEYNKKSKKGILRGGSTITQQLAKNLFLPPSRTYIRKYIEAYYTVLMEFLWNKERILYLYANVIEYAPNVYGIESAAQHHFKKPTNQLSSKESALLAAVLPNPKRWNASKPSKYIQNRSRQILRDIVPLPSTMQKLLKPTEK